MTHWTDSIEQNTGEVSVFAIADYLGIPVQTVMTFANERHGARYVGGTSAYLIWREDAQALEDHYRAEWAKQ